MELLRIATFSRLLPVGQYWNFDGKIQGELRTITDKLVELCFHKIIILRVLRGRSNPLGITESVLGKHVASAYPKTKIITTREVQKGNTSAKEEQ